MKILVVSIVLMLSCSQSFARNLVIPDVNNPVVGLLGSSFVDPESAPNNALGLTSLNGASYRGIADYLKARSINEKRGIVYRENAEGGGTTNGQGGFQTLLQQAQQLVEHTTMWPDGTHMKVAVIFQFNDCLHNLAGLCDIQRVLAEPVANSIDTIEYLQSNGIKVFVTNLIDYHELDLPLLEEVFSEVVPGFTSATESQYNLYKHTYESEISALPGVTMIDVWDGMQHIGDGLHPDHRSRQKASRRLHKQIKKYLRRNSVWY